jgi:hypothetical protein
MDSSEVMSHILARYEAGELISTCAWCGRVAIDGEWVLPTARSAHRDRRAAHAVTFDLPDVLRHTTGRRHALLGARQE